ncbi:MAG: pyridoxamine 5'-phosphate oxidase family protein [Burkholderiaceae bacterium]
MTPEFKDTITTAAQLREVLGQPSAMVEAKVIPALDVHCREFIANCPFLLIASADDAGKVDVSPKGDPAGFVQVLDEHTVAIPERLGNRLADTFLNILKRPQVGLLFVIPGKRETLRAGGTARIVRDDWLLERMMVSGKKPALATVVTLDRVFFHCAKFVIRSSLWNPQGWPDTSEMASLAQALKDHAKRKDSVEALQEGLDASYRDRLY